MLYNTLYRFTNYRRLKKVFKISGKVKEKLGVTDETISFVKRTFSRKLIKMKASVITYTNFRSRARCYFTLNSYEYVALVST